MFEQVAIATRGIYLERKRGMFKAREIDREKYRGMFKARKINRARTLGRAVL